MKQFSNVFEAITRTGSDDDFAPRLDDEHFKPTTAPPGSHEKLEILAARVLSGLPLWHDEDRNTMAPKTRASGSSAPIDEDVYDDDYLDY